MQSDGMLVNNIDKLVSWLEQLKNYGQEQAPDVVRELISYTIYADGIWMKLAIFLFIIGVALVAIDISTSHYGPSPMTLVGIILFGGGILLWANAYLEIKKIEKAPKLFVFDYVTEKIQDIKK